MKLSFRPRGVCCREMVFEINNENTITDVDFVGGCAGNLMGLKHLIIGSNANEIADKLENITCGAKATSCPDQFSKALREYLAN